MAEHGIPRDVSCDRCSQPTSIDLLDAKPNDPARAESCDWERLECPACYGPGYLPGGAYTWADAQALAAARGVTLVAAAHG